VDGLEVRQLAARVDLVVAAHIKQSEAARVAGDGELLQTRDGPVNRAALSKVCLSLKATSYGCQAVLHSRIGVCLQVFFLQHAAVYLVDAQQHDAEEHWQLLLC
jgi:hypothetical protein